MVRISDPDTGYGGTDDDSDDGGGGTGPGGPAGRDRIDEETRDDTSTDPTDDTDTTDDDDGVGTGPGGPAGRDRIDEETRDDASTDPTDGGADTTGGDDGALTGEQARQAETMGYGDDPLVGDEPETRGDRPEDTGGQGTFGDRRQPDRVQVTQGGRVIVRDPRTGQLFFSGRDTEGIRGEPFDEAPEGLVLPGEPRPPMQGDPQIETPSTGAEGQRQAERLEQAEEEFGEGADRAFLNLQSETQTEVSPDDVVPTDRGLGLDVAARQEEITARAAMGTPFRGSQLRATETAAPAPGAVDFDQRGPQVTLTAEEFSERAAAIEAQRTLRGMQWRESLGIGRIGTLDSDADDGMDIPDEPPRGQFGGQVTRAPNESTIEIEGIDDEPDTLEALGAAGSEVADFLTIDDPAELGRAFTGPPGTIESSLGDAAFYARDVSSEAVDFTATNVGDPVASFLGEGAERFVGSTPTIFGADVSEQAAQGIPEEDAFEIEPETGVGTGTEAYTAGATRSLADATVGLPAFAVETGDVVAGAGEFTYESISEEGFVEGGQTAAATGAGVAAGAAAKTAEFAGENPLQFSGLITGGAVGGVLTGAVGSRAFTAARGRVATRGMDFQDEIPIENIERPDVRQGSGLTRLSERAAPEGGLAMPEAGFPVRPSAEPVTEIRRLADEFDDPRIRSALDVGPEEYTFFRAVRGVRDDIYEPRSRRPYDPDATFLAPSVARNFLDLEGTGTTTGTGLRLPRPVAATRSLISAGRRETPTIMATAGRVDPLPERISGRADLTDYLQEQRNTGRFFAPSRGAQQTVTGESEVFVSAEGAVSTEPMTWRGRRLDPDEMEGTGVVEPGETTQFVQADDPFVTEIRGERVPIQVYRQDTGDVTPLGQQGGTLSAANPLSSGGGIRQFLSDERGQLGARGGAVDVDPYQDYSVGLGTRLGYDYQPGGAPGTPVYPTALASDTMASADMDAQVPDSDAALTEDGLQYRGRDTDADLDPVVTEPLRVQGTERSPTYPRGQPTLATGGATTSPTEPTTTDDPTTPTTPTEDTPSTPTSPPTGGPPSTPTSPPSPPSPPTGGPPTTPSQPPRGPPSTPPPTRPVVPDDSDRPDDPIDEPEFEEWWKKFEYGVADPTEVATGSSDPISVDEAIDADLDV